MRKVLKSTATVITKKIGNAEKECVELRFQYNKEIKPIEDGAIKIYKRHDEGFVFDWDEMEYFDGMLPTPDELIFDGEIPVVGTFCEFVDEDVELGEVYVYWIAKGDSAPAGPLAVKIRSSRIWWSYDRICNELDSLAADFPSAELITEGYTVLGRPLRALYAGNRERCIALVGAIHAGESGPEILIPAVRNLLTNHPDLLTKVGIALLPVVNADNREAMVRGLPPYVRKNAAGVDLNRNFDALWEVHDDSYGMSSFNPLSPTYHGRCPNSEPEVKATVAVMERATPRAVFSYHHLCSVTSDRALTAHESAGDESFLSRSNALSRIYSDAFRSAMGLAPVENTDVVLGCSVGSLPSWCYKNGSVPCFDFEMSPTTTELHPATHDLTTPEILASATAAHTAGIKAALEFLAK